MCYYRKLSGKACQGQSALLQYTAPSFQLCSYWVVFSKTVCYRCLNWNQLIQCVNLWGNLLPVVGLFRSQVIGEQGIDKVSIVQVQDQNKKLIFNFRLRMDPSSLQVRWWWWTFSTSHSDPGFFSCIWTVDNKTQIENSIPFN